MCIEKEDAVSGMQLSIRADLTITCSRNVPCDTEIVNAADANSWFTINDEIC